MSPDDADPDSEPAADRRGFLRRAAAVAATSVAVPVLADPRDALEPWRTQPGRSFSTYGQPAAAEIAVQRWPSPNPAAPGNGASWSPLHQLEGSLTPAGLHFERHHNGIPDIDPARHELRIFGRVRHALAYTLDDLLRYPRITRRCFIECGGNSNTGWRDKPAQGTAGHLHGLVSCSEWTGIPLAALLAEVEPQAAAAWIIAEGADAFSLTMSIPLAKAREDCLLVLFQNGERLRPEQGYPLRLLVPGWEGVLNVKWLTNVQISDQPAMARNETSKYTELLPDGSARAFTFVMEPKSLITMPSAGSRLPGPGWYEIAGLAWSGYGAVSRVEVSVDGGDTWAAAVLEPPVLAQAWTRFRYGWQWTGAEAVLQSRVTDTSGRVQPSRSALLASRGRSAYFHYHAIVSWAVAADGAVSHVYVDATSPRNELDELLMDRAWD